MRLFSDHDISVLKGMAARGATANEIGLKLGRSPLSIRVKCCALGINLRPRRRQWHVLRLLLEPQLIKVLTLAARRRGLRTGELARRIITAALWFDVVEVLLRPSPRDYKVARIEDAIANPSERAVAVQVRLVGRVHQPVLSGSMSA